MNRRTLIAAAAVLFLAAVPLLGNLIEGAGPAPQSPGWISLAPTIVAIVVALVSRSIVPALFLGVWVGAWAAVGLNGVGLVRGLLNTFEIHTLEAVADSDHATILLFSMMIGGLVGICQMNGGMKGLAHHVARFASSRRSGQGATTMLGVLVFFDDYANLLIVGNVMRPMTDKLRISREKLAYLVDSTAAPIAAVAFMTTWIGFEVGVIEESLRAIGATDIQPYGVFLHSLLYSFYPWLTLFFIALLVITGRDFGPMAKAERDADQRSRSETAETHTLPADSVNATESLTDQVAAGPTFYAVIPIAVMVVVMLAGLCLSGEGATLFERIADADAMTALLRGSLLGVLTAVVLSVVGRRLSLSAAMEAWYQGVESVLLGLITLVLAWALADTTEVLGTAQYLSGLVEGNVAVGLLPAIAFCLAALVSLSTGSAWGTMGLLMPISIPLVWQQAGGNSGQAEDLIAATIAAVLGGAVFGDHCSPISDTTILSSLSCRCDHLSHVHTQLPYAVLCATVATLAGTIPAALGISPWWCMLGAASLLTVSFFALSKPLPDRSRSELSTSREL